MLSLFSEESRLTRPHGVTVQGHIGFKERGGVFLNSFLAVLEQAGIRSRQSDLDLGQAHSTAVLSFPSANLNCK